MPAGKAVRAGLRHEGVHRGRGRVDDTVFASGTGQTLWLTDPDHNTVDAVTGDFASGTALSSVTPKTGADYLASLNLDNGTLTPIAGLAAVHPKGLLFTSAG